MEPFKVWTLWVRISLQPHGTYTNNRAEAGEGKEAGAANRLADQSRLSRDSRFSLPLPGFASGFERSPSAINKPALQLKKKGDDRSTTFSTRNTLHPWRYLSEVSVTVTDIIFFFSHPFSIYYLIVAYFISEVRWSPWHPHSRLHLAAAELLLLAAFAGVNFRTHQLPPLPPQKQSCSPCSCHLTGPIWV